MTEMWSTIAGWTVLLVGGAAVTYYYNPEFVQRWMPQPQLQPIPQEFLNDRSTRKPKTNKRHKFEDGRTPSNPTSGNEAPSKKRKISTPIENTVKAMTTQGQQAELPRDDAGELSNKAFAEQLKKAQTGTKLEKSQASSEKERRPQKVGLQPQTGLESASLSADTSSTGGRDGDDDLSATENPPIRTPSTAQISRAGDVTDMLEPAAAKPTTLKLTGITPSQPKQALKQPAEQTLTKKQRQRAAKNEENRLAREESDRIHEAKKQQQLRAARTAAGTSTQIRANQFGASAQNAWQKKPDVQAEQSAPQPHQQPLLDTFEPEPSQQRGSVRAAPMENITNGAVRAGTASAAKEAVGEHKTEALAASAREGRPDLSRGASWADEVNDDAQEKWAKDLIEEQTWEEVSTKKSKKKGKKDTDESSEASVAPAKPKPAANGAKENTTVRSQNMNRFASMEQINGGDGTWEP